MREKWIDCAKIIAILAVVIDHTAGMAYNNVALAKGSYFSVTVFIFLAGVTAYKSYDKNKDSDILKILPSKLLGILVPYACAVIPYSIISHEWTLNLNEYITDFLSFNISSPFYFILFYIQLVFISPWLYKLVCNLKKYPKYVVGVVVILLFAVAAFTIKFTFILPVWGGGRYLFGGTYLPVYFMGMFLSPYMCKRKISGIQCITAGAGMIVMYLFWLKNDYQLDCYLPFGQGLNPPGITLILYSFSWIIFLYYLFVYLEEKNRISGKIVDFLAICGRYSLYVFLYHRFLLDYIIPRIKIAELPMGALKMLVYYVILIGIPVLGKRLYDYLYKKFID